MKRTPIHERVDAALVGAAVGLALAIAAAGLLLLMPCFQMSQSTTVTQGGGGPHEPAVLRTECRSLLQAADVKVLYVLAFPVAMSAANLLFAFRGWRVAATMTMGLLGLFVLATGFSIGLFFIPAAMAGMVSVVLLLSSRFQNQPAVPSDPVT